jgi:hypothetical protein
MRGDGKNRMTSESNIILELRALAHLIEMKATLKEQDAEKLRRAADEIEVLRRAVTAEREEILELIQSHRADAHLYDGDSALRRAAGAIQARIRL